MVYGLCPFTVKSSDLHKHKLALEHDNEWIRSTSAWDQSNIAVQKAKAEK